MLEKGNLGIKAEQPFHEEKVAPNDYKAFVFSLPGDEKEKEDLIARETLRISQLGELKIFFSGEVTNLFVILCARNVASIKKEIFDYDPYDHEGPKDSFINMPSNMQRLLGNTKLNSESLTSKLKQRASKGLNVKTVELDPETGTLNIYYSKSPFAIKRYPDLYDEELCRLDLKAGDEDEFEKRWVSQAGAVVVNLNRAIGDAVISEAFINSLRKVLDAMGMKEKIIYVTYPYVGNNLLELYKFHPGIKAVPADTLTRLMNEDLKGKPYFVYNFFSGGAATNSDRPAYSEAKGGPYINVDLHSYTFLEAKKNGSMLKTESHYPLKLMGENPEAATTPPDKARIYLQNGDVTTQTEKYGFNNWDQNIGIVVGHHYNFPHKQWGMDNYAQLLDLLATANPSHCFRVFVAPDLYQPEYILIAQLATNHPNISIIKEPSLYIVACLMSKCNKFFGNDTGLMQVAQAASEGKSLVIGGGYFGKQWSSRDDTIFLEPPEELQKKDLSKKEKWPIKKITVQQVLDLYHSL